MGGWGEIQVYFGYFVNVAKPLTINFKSVILTINILLSDYSAQQRQTGEKSDEEGR